MAVGTLSGLCCWAACPTAAPAPARACAAPPRLQAGGNVVRLVGLYHAQRGAHTFFLKQQTVARNPEYIVNLLHYEDAARLAVAVGAGVQWVVCGARHAPAGRPAGSCLHQAPCAACSWAHPACPHTRRQPGRLRCAGALQQRPWHPPPPLVAQVLMGEGNGGQPYRGQLVLGSDNHPVSFRDMMAACEASGLWPGQVGGREQAVPADRQAGPTGPGAGAWSAADAAPGTIPPCCPPPPQNVSFTAGPEAGLGKRVDSSASRAKLGGWAPRYASFDSFMRQDGGRDFYTTSGLF